MPTYKRPETLFKAIHSIQEQTLPQFEILVVDNAADPTLEQAIARSNSEFRIPVCYVPEPHIGSHNARHTGAKIATGDILVFTDDDVTFEPGWLHAYVAVFANYPEMAAAGGAVRPVWEQTPPPWLTKYIGTAKMFPILSIMEPYKQFRLDPSGYFFSVNMAIRRKLLFEVGGFNPDLFGDYILGDGETGLIHKLRDAGMLIGYIPEALLYHHIPPSRMTVKYFHHRIVNEGACIEYTRFHKYIPGSLGLYLRIMRIWMELPMRLGYHIILKGLMLNLYPLDVLSIKARLQLAYHWSRLDYVHRLFNDQTLRELVTKADWLDRPNTP